MNIIKFDSIHFKSKGLCFLVIASGKCIDVLTTGILLVLKYFQNFSLNL